jgi:hypothetical protein
MSESTLEPILCQHLVDKPGIPYMGMPDENGVAFLGCSRCSARKMYKLLSDGTSPSTIASDLYVQNLESSAVTRLIYELLVAFRAQTRKNALSPANHVGFRNPKPSDVIHRFVKETR